MRRKTTPSLDLLRVLLRTKMIVDRNKHELDQAQPLALLREIDGLIEEAYLLVDTKTLQRLKDAIESERRAIEPVNINELSDPLLIGRMTTLSQLINRYYIISEGLHMPGNGE